MPQLQRQAREPRTGTNIQQRQPRMRREGLQEVEGPQEMLADNPSLVGDRGEVEAAIAILSVYQEKLRRQR